MNKIIEIISKSILNKKTIKFLNNLNQYSKFSNLKTLKDLTKNSSVSAISIYKKNFELKTNFKDDLFEINYDSKNSKLSKQLPYIWLRDNCKCSSCWNNITEENEIDLDEIEIDVRPSRIHRLDESDNECHFEIIWQDGHSSKYNLIELSKYVFENDIKRMNKYTQQFLWNEKLLKENNAGFNSFKYDDYLKDENVLRQVLESIIKYGAAIIENVPQHRKEIVKVTQRIAQIQTTFFGSDCVVTNQLGFSDRAYTNMKLKAHTDNAYLYNCAGLELFHIVQKAEEGGESLFIDGFYCAELLRENFPIEFESLTNINVLSQFYKKDQYDIKHVDPIIKLNPLNGEVSQIRFNPYNKLNLTHLSKDKIVEFYNAFKKFTQIIQNQNNVFWISLNPDQIVIFDNFRLLHGRSSFRGNRTLITTYISRDEWTSKASILNAIK